MEFVLLSSSTQGFLSLMSSVSRLLCRKVTTYLFTCLRNHLPRPGHGWLLGRVRGLSYSGLIGNLTQGGHVQLMESCFSFSELVGWLEGFPESWQMMWWGPCWTVSGGLSLSKANLQPFVLVYQLSYLLEPQNLIFP